MAVDVSPIMAPKARPLPACPVCGQAPDGAGPSGFVCPRGHRWPRSAGQALAAEADTVSELKAHAAARAAALASLAGSMRRRGMGRESIEAALLAENAARCRPPLPEAEVRRIANSVSRYEPAEDAATADELKAHAVARMAQDEQGRKPEAARPRYILRWLAEALQAPAPMEWVAQDLFPAVGVGVLFGDPGSKKTWSGLHLAVSVAMGAPWLGRPVKQGPVLLVDEESGDGRLRRRLAQVVRGLNAPADLPLAYVTSAGFKPAKSEDLAELDSLLASVQPVLVIVDAFRDVLHGDENSSEDTQLLMEALRQLANRHGCLMLAIHHANKNGGYRGSSAILAAADVFVNVTSRDGSPNVDFETTKTRDGEACKFAATASWLDWPEEVFTLTEAAVRQKAPHYSRAEEYVLGYLDQHGPSLLTDIIGHADACSESAARHAAYNLVARRAIRRCDGGGAGRSATYELAPAQEKPESPDPA